MMLAFQDAQSVSAAQVGASHLSEGQFAAVLGYFHTNPEASFTTAPQYGP
jgi:hypothetical protein